ncbi:NAD(P)/FAD-dependent oxidoreductase [Streptomyces sodiiphilus]
MVIVGAGVAGATAARTLRSAGFDGRVVLIGDEPEHPYRRPPLSKDVLLGRTAPERTRLWPPEHWAGHRIELRTGTRAVRLDTGRRLVGLADGSELAYDRLLLATGGRARRLPAAEGLEGVHTLRTLADAARLRAALVPGTRVLVVGGGLIGAEVAATARTLGCPVTVLEPEPYPLARVLPPPVARLFASLHRRQGVDLRTGIALERLKRTDHGAFVATGTDGRRWTADVVVVAIGMRPCTALADAAGLTTGDGIVVNEHAGTSAPGVFAAGDVASRPNPLLGGRYRAEHWQAAQEQGAAAAHAMLGRPARPPRVPWCWSDQYGVNLQICGWPEAGDDIRFDGDPDGMDFTAAFHRGGLMTGAVSVNRPKEMRALRERVERPLL